MIQSMESPDNSGISESGAEEDTNSKGESQGKQSEDYVYLDIDISAEEDFSLVEIELGEK